MATKTVKRRKPQQDLSPAETWRLLKRLSGLCDAGLKRVQGKPASKAWAITNEVAALESVAQQLGIGWDLLGIAWDTGREAAFAHANVFSVKAYRARCDAYRKVITVPMLIAAAKKKGLI